MAKALLAVLVLASATAAAQSTAADAGTPAPSAAPAVPPPSGATPGGTASAEDEGTQSSAELDRKLEEVKKELREEVRASLATQSVAEGWEEEWVEQTRKLELLELDGYLRVRPELFHKFDLNRGRDRAGFTLFPRSPVDEEDRTIAGTNMRLRVEPTINVSEEVRIRVQVDALDNLIWGSTPDYAFSQYPYNEFAIFSEGQQPELAGLNSPRDSISVKRAYGEVSTPVGILRFGRMGSHWGLGMLRNDGNCLDCEVGDTIDRLQFVTEPLPGVFVTPMLEFNVEGPTSEQTLAQGQPFDLANSDDSHSLVLAIARRDTDQQVKAKLENGEGVFQYGLHFSLRRQRFSAVGFEQAPYGGQGGDLGSDALVGAYVPRSATLYIPDVWARYERKKFRIELELAAQLGSIDNRAPSSAVAGDPDFNQNLQVVQFGGVAQGEYRFLDGDMRLQLELGFASGDRAPGLGILQRRPGSGPGGRTERGDIDGPQYACSSSRCEDGSLRNFRFNRDYQIDEILFEEILGTVTDALYVKPTLTYSLADGFDLFGSLIGSRALYAESTPSGRRNGLGLEFNAGARYLTEDGFIASFTWAILFPLSGLENPTALPNEGLETAQSLKAMLGVRF